MANPKDTTSLFLIFYEARARQGNALCNVHAPVAECLASVCSRALATMCRKATSQSQKKLQPLQPLPVVSRRGQTWPCILSFLPIPVRANGTWQPPRRASSPTSRQGACNDTGPASVLLPGESQPRPLSLPAASAVTLSWAFRIVSIHAAELLPSM